MEKRYREMLAGMQEKEKARRRSKRRGEKWFLYILKCADESLYTGITKDLERRFKSHSEGKAARYTRTRRPLEVVYREPCRSRTEALVRECAVKSLPKSKKLALIVGKRQAVGLSLLFLILLLMPGSAQSAERRHLFYLHGAWLESHSPNDRHPVHGRYQYQEIVETLSGEGFEVTSEIRLPGTDFNLYAGKLASEIRRLLESGVSARQITVAGHSKGGLIALLVAARLGEPEIRYVILAGCGRRGTPFRKPYERFLRQFASGVSGRLLSLYDKADREAGTCEETFRLAPGAKGDEIVLNTGKGHGLFYSPSSAWIEPLVRWSEGK